MGLLDILNGMQNGPHGQAHPATPGKSSGMSPLTMALLGLLAYKALNSSGALGSILGGSPKTPSAPPPNPGTPAPSGLPGGLGDILGGLLGGARTGSPAAPAGSPAGSPTGGLGDILGGLLGNANAGNALNGGLRNLLGDLADNGHAEVAKSWVGPGENKSIAPNDLAKALGADTISALSSQTGMSRDDLLAEISQKLPNLVDQLTPNGRLPTDQESSRWL